MVNNSWLLPISETEIWRSKQAFTSIKYATATLKQFWVISIRPKKRCQNTWLNKQYPKTIPHNSFPTSKRQQHLLTVWFQTVYEDSSAEKHCFQYHEAHEKHLWMKRLNYRFICSVKEATEQENALNHVIKLSTISRVCKENYVIIYHRLNIVKQWYQTVNGSSDICFHKLFYFTFLNFFIKEKEYFNWKNLHFP